MFKNKVKEYVIKTWILYQFVKLEVRLLINFQQSLLDLLPVIILMVTCESVG